jgi:hypothetical protein
MKKRRAIRQMLMTLFLVLAAYLISGCAVPPDEKIVKDSIVQYFQARNYKVVELGIADIKPLPLSEKVYMGTRGYIVNIKLITLVAVGDSAELRRHKEKERLTFRNAVLQIREKAGEQGRWEISVISGIPIL